MALDPAAHLDAAEQAGLVQLLEDWRTSKAVYEASEVALSASLVSSLAAGGADEGADVFYNGRVVAGDEMTLPGGLVPEIMVTRRDLAKANRGKGKPRHKQRPRKGKAQDKRRPRVRRHAQAAVSEVDMKAADDAHQHRDLMLVARSIAAQAFNARLNALIYRPPGMVEGTAVDAFNDGLIKKITDINWPADLVQGTYRAYRQG